MKPARVLLALAPLVAALAVALPARADDESGVLDSRHKRYESPQHFAFEVRMGPYKPMIDGAPELNGKTPYQDTFGTTPQILFQAELDWQALKIPHLGTLGPGVGFGYTSNSATARLKSDPRLFSGEETGLEIYPMYGIVVLRADVFMKELRIPLVPYLKGGLGFSLWRATKGGATSSPGGKGATWGSHAAVGLALHLNAFDQAAARNLDNNIGINHTYAFIEAMAAQLTGLGQTSALMVGSHTWVAGLAFEM